ncbi:MAG: alanine--tRNA ligase [Microbacter sp.]
MKTSQEIRQSFLDFFSSKNHHIVPSAPMVIKDDPTLMFTNAGMNQFKNIILGNDPVVYPRVADSQKCLRVSGKHNDLEEVGHDTYHHTMFEMLGNWSFGDYFKKEAIEWAWEYLTEVLGIDKQRLYVTVFEGSPNEGLERDEEAAHIWANLIDPKRIINGNRKDNFWEMGDTGPCGPCSEIHIDIRPNEERAKKDGLELVNQNHPQVIEIWNLVFMQYNRKADGSLEPLPAKVIDTGMGFERLCMAIQGKQSNYDTDVFQPIINEIAALCNIPYGQNEQTDIAMRVVADHIRTIAFAITDGQLPSNVKAGYVIRRILRRAVRYGYTFLNQKQAFIYQLIPALIRTMGDAYPELKAQRSLIEKVIKEEEESFLRTLETGIRLLDKVMTDAKHAGISVISGHDAFTLYDTYGFPLDLTELILKENNLSLDHSAFQKEMQQQKDRARNAAAVETGDWVIIREGETEFTGYDTTENEVRILRYREVKQKNNHFYQLVLDRTPFYAEMGGQVGDCGTLTNDMETIAIVDTKRENNLAVHIATALPADPSASFTAKVDTKKRKATENNHTATHLLHEALRKVLGNHVEQKGSFVSPEALRFDFSHFQKMTDKELQLVEQEVNHAIRENRPLHEFRHVPIAQAREMGAMALFGEKYGDDVRVIQFGSSIELCGGTHVAATGEIGCFKVIAESSVAAGIRRIEAVTAEGAELFVRNQQALIKNIREKLHQAPSILQGLQKLLDEHAALTKQVEQYRDEKTEQLYRELLQNVKTENNIDFVLWKGEASADIVRTVTTRLKNKFQHEPFAAIFGTIQENKPSLTVLLSQSLVETGQNASAIVRQAALAIDGKGGGQPFLATASGKNSSGLEAAMKEAKALILKQ